MATDDKDTKAKAKKPTPTPAPPAKGQDPMLALQKARSIGAGKPADVADPILQHLQWQQGRPQSAVGQPGDPMAALSKAQTIGAPQGPWTPLSGPQDSPLMQVAHALLGNARVVSGPGGRSPATQIPDLMGLVGPGEGEAGAASGPIARFLGWQKGIPEKGIPHMPMYNVEAPGHPLDRSTVTPATLASHGIPFTPPPPHGFDAAAPLVTGQGEQVSPGFFNKPVPTAPTPPPTDPMTQLVSRFGGKGPSDPRPNATSLPASSLWKDPAEQQRLQKNIRINPSTGKSFEEQSYPFTQNVRVHWPDGTYHDDAVKGMNSGHAIARAWSNWPGAQLIEPLGGQ